MFFTGYCLCSLNFFLVILTFVSESFSSCEPQGFKAMSLQLLQTVKLYSVLIFLFLLKKSSLMQRLFRWLIIFCCHVHTNSIFIFYVNIFLLIENTHTPILSLTRFETSTSCKGGRGDTIGPRGHWLCWFVTCYWFPFTC